MQILRPAVFVILVLLLFINSAFAYNFSENSSSADSVRLTLNTNKSLGNILAIDIMASQVSNIYSAAFDLDFNSSILKWAGRFAYDPNGYEKGNFFGSSALYDIGHEIFVNGSANQNRLVAGAVGTSASVSGSGSIITIKFNIVGNGTSPISFYGNNLIRPDMSFTSSSWYGGTFRSGNDTLYPQEVDNPPIVSLVTANEKSFSTPNITLVCSASDDFQLVNITLYTNIGGSMSPYRTRNLSDKIWTEEFLLTNINPGSYAWNCGAYDTKGQQTLGDINYTFTVISPPAGPLLSGGQPFGTLTNNSVTLSLQTDRAATCKYATIPGMTYASMLFNLSANGTATTHSKSLYLDQNQSYKFYVRCIDTNGNADTDDYVISFSIGSADTSPPIISLLTSSGNLPFSTSSVDLLLDTNKDSECRYSTQSGSSFASMSLFSNTFLKNHTTSFSGLHEGTSYSYFVKCSDSGNHISQESQINFFVCYEADADCNRAVSLSEMNQFISRWKANNRDVTLTRLLSVLSLWKKGSA